MEVVPLVKRLLAFFRPEEVIGAFFLVLLVVLRLTFENAYHRPLAVVSVAYGAAYLLPVGFFLILYLLVWLRQEDARHPVRDWLPFIICLLTYEMLHGFVHDINPHDRDALLSRLDFLIFGVHPTVWLQRLASPQLTDYLSFCYITYFLFPPALGVMLYFRRRLEDFRDVMLSVVIACFAGYIGYVLVPAVGPKYFEAGLYTNGLSGGQTGQAIIYAMDNLRVSRDCFPSLHTAVTAVVLIFAARSAPTFFWVTLPVGASLVLATMYLRYHYFVDVVAGLALAFAAAWLGVRLNRWWYKNIRGIV